MNINRLVKQLSIDEGKTNRVHKNSEGKLRVGVGHIIKDTDLDSFKSLKVGDKLKDSEINELFMSDLASALQDSMIVFDTEWENLPAPAKEAIINMMFGLGRHKFLEFQEFIKAIYAHEWILASNEITKSSWAFNNATRAGRLSSKIELLARAD